MFGNMAEELLQELTKSSAIKGLEHILTCEMKIVQDSSSKKSTNQIRL